LTWVVSLNSDAAHVAFADLCGAFHERIASWLNKTSVAQRARRGLVHREVVQAAAKARAHLVVPVLLLTAHEVIVRRLIVRVAIVRRLIVRVVIVRPLIVRVVTVRRLTDRALRVLLQDQQ
jgi:hypothetical protein